jgi:hypothetical protein
MAMPPNASKNRLSIDSGIIKGAHYVTSNNFNHRVQSQMQMGEDDLIQNNINPEANTIKSLKTSK